MGKIQEKLRSLWRRYKLDLGAVTAIIAAVIVGNLFYLTITNPNPILKRSMLPLTEQIDATRYVSGDNTIDPNDGFSKQALGSAAADQLLSGKMPYWNHYEGVGFPLLAGMQSAALFPLTPLLKLPGGFLIFEMVLEIIAGIGAYLLLKRLGLGRRLAVFGGILFAISSLFSWVVNAVCTPIPFLPWLLYAIEGLFLSAKNGDKKRSRTSAACFALALALSLYAGFPETAYINGLFALAWAVVRFVELKKKQLRTVFARYLIMSGVIGLLLSAPVVVPFLMHVSTSLLGLHENNLDSFGISWIGLPMLFTPYIYGGIFASSSLDIQYVWMSIGGYIGVGVLLFAIFGLFSNRLQKGLKWLLVATVIISVARVFAVPGISQLLGFIPGFGATAVYRYIMPIIVISIIILACYGAGFVYKNGFSKRMKITYGVALAAIIGVIATIVKVQSGAIAATEQLRLWQVISVATFAIPVVAVSSLVFLSNKKSRRQLLTYIAIGAVILESTILFLLPQLAAVKRPVSVDTRPVQFLQDNMGNQRFFSLGQIAANYGSFFKVASINNNDLPVPRDWANYIEQKLQPENGDYVNFTGFQPTVKQEFLKNIENYQAIGVKYVVGVVNSFTDDEARQYGLVEVYNKNTIVIWQLPTYTEYFSADGCEIKAQGRDEVSTNCQSETVLKRLELYYDGWEVTVNGQPASISKIDDLVQGVKIPAGESKVVFTYKPPYNTLNWAMFGAGVVWLLVLVLQPENRNSKPRVKARAKKN